MVEVIIISSITIDSIINLIVNLIDLTNSIIIDFINVMDFNEEIKKMNIISIIFPIVDFNIHFIIPMGHN